MTRITLTLLSCVMAAAVVGLHAQGTPEALLKTALQLEQIDGNDTGAMAQYKALVDKFPANHVVAARALLQLAGLYERHGQPDEARRSLERILADHPSGGASVSTARERLKGLQGSNPGPFKITELDEWLKGADRIAPAPDGKYLLFVRGAASAFIRELETGRERPLIELKNGETLFANPTWSPDARHVAFSVKVPNIDGVERRLVTVGSSQVRTMGLSNPRLGGAYRWSGDSRRVAFLKKGSSSPYEVHVWTVSDGSDVNVGATVLRDGLPGFPGALFSPDSTRIAFLATAGGAEVIRVTTIATGQAVDLTIAQTRAGGQTSLQAWTPTGDIYYQQPGTGGENSFLINVASGRTRTICEGHGKAGGDSCGQLTPDGAYQLTRQIATGGGRTALRSTTTGAERMLTREAVFEQAGVGFSPDGRLVAFRSNRDGAYALYVLPIDRVPVANPVKIMSLESQNSDVAGTWTPGGLVLRITDIQTNIYRADVDPQTHQPIGPPVRLTQDSPDNRMAYASPDGRRIAYLSRGSSTGIALMDANGARERIVKEIPGGELSRIQILGWSQPDQLVLSNAGLDTGQLRTAPKHIGVLNTTTGEITYQTATINTPGMALVSGPQMLVYGTADQSGLVVRALRGGSERTVALPGDWLNFVASPDAKSVAYSIADFDKKPTQGEIRLRDVDTGVERPLLKYANAKDADHAPLAFSPDGKFLAYRDPDLRIQILNMETGKSTPLLIGGPADVDFEFTGLDWSPDGTYITFYGNSTRTTWKAVSGVTYEAVTRFVDRKK